MTHRVTAHAERTVRAKAEDSSRRNTERGSTWAVLPGLAWYSLPLSSSTSSSSVLSTQTGFPLTHADSPPECASPKRDRDGWGKDQACKPLVVCVGPPQRENVHTTQTITAAAVESGVSSAQSDSRSEASWERKGRGHKGGVYFGCLVVGWVDPLQHTHRHPPTHSSRENMGGKLRGQGREERDGVQKEGGSFRKLP